MQLSKVCIERPVFATVLSLLLIVLGIIAYLNLSMRYFPEVQEPFATVSVSYSGASASLMREQVTKILENSLVNIKGVANMQSTSRYNSASVTLFFNPKTDMVQAMGDVRDQVSSVRDQLPPDANPPSISSGGVARPALSIGFMDKDLSATKIRDYVEQSIVPEFSNLPGMGAVQVLGASSYAMRIWLDSQKMAALGITVADVKSALLSNNLFFSGGSIRGVSRNYTIVSDTKLHTVNDFKGIIIRDVGGHIVYLRDVANVVLGSKSLQDAPMRLNGQSAISMELRPLDSANPIEVAKQAKAVLAQLQGSMPKGMTVKVTYDQSQFLQLALDQSFETLFEAIALVVLVVFLFLGSFRASMVPIATIPVCVISIFTIMLALGYSINVMTLLASILAIGLVVDDAIVMLENVHAYIEKGMNPKQAAFKGSAEIGFSIIAMTLTLAAVYAPIGFLSGFSASVFREFAFTLAGAVLISGFVALTLSPMMCSLVLKSHEKQSSFEQYIHRVFSAIAKRYQGLLQAVLKNRLKVVLVLVVIALLGYLLSLVVPQSFIPKEDIGYFQAGITSPGGATVDYTNNYMQRLEKVYHTQKDLLSYASLINSGSATNFITLKPWGERKETAEKIIQNLQNKFNAIPGAIVTLDMPDPVSYGPTMGGSEVGINVMTQGDYQSLQQTLNKVLAKLKQYPGIVNPRSNLKFDSRVYNIQFNRSAAASYNVSLNDIADSVSTLLAGSHITDIESDGQSFQVRVQMDLKDLGSFDALNNIYVRSATVNADGSAVMVPLSNLVTLKPAIRQTKQFRYNRMNAATISADLAPGYDLGRVVAFLKKNLPSYLGHKDSYAFGGRIEAYLASNGTMLGLFLLSIAFIYLVLAAQFESFIDPWIILLTVPLCIVGALFTLYLLGGSLNLYTNIGMITLVGLITKHGILITKFANDRLQEGKDLLSAISDAAVSRLRPILMTTFAMVLGALPLALTTGPGSNSASQIGYVIVGGMLFGTIFSLLVVPVAYYFLAPLDQDKRILIQKSSKQVTFKI